MISVNNKRDFIAHDYLIFWRVESSMCVSVKHSVWNSVWYSVHDSIHYSVWNPLKIKFSLFKSFAYIQYMQNFIQTPLEITDAYKLSHWAQ